MRIALEQNVRAVENMRVMLKGLAEKTKNVSDDVYGGERIPAAGIAILPAE